ncbi:MAG: GH32 C-terminal domain-containing protein [Muribaculaceae bacterium]|nr:GH32 C-terminal domain-containing protein [Muribaculaceae bacterium]
MKKTSVKVLTLLASMAIGLNPADAANGGVKVEHLGTNNTIVRVDSDARYMLLPVQESNDDATVNIVVDGKLERTIFVRLAKSKVDYTMPLDLSDYSGHDVLLNIITSQNRSSVREAKEDACWSAFSMTDTLDTANREKYHPAFHHTPLYGWMNDPNGMFYKDGVWHLYYQWNPYGSKWQNMTWGHSSSRDLVHWDHHPAAIEPNGLGSVFSGSSAIDHAGSAGFGKDAVVAMYTSAGASQTQSLAWSTDNGATFNIYPGNPVITLESEARDPNMFWNDETHEWTLVLAHALDKEMLIFTSPDMKAWTLQSSFGKGLGAQDGVWECPDLFPLTTPDGTAEKWVLICNINPGGPFGGSAIQYFTGTFDGKTFRADTDAAGNVPTKWLDHGKDNYALVSWSDAPDGRRTAIGWMSNWQYAAEVPTMQYRSANTLPRDLSLFFDTDGQAYVASTPVPELDSMRDRVVAQASNRSVGSKYSVYSLPEANGGICEIVLDITPQKAAAIDMLLSNQAGEKTVIKYDAATDCISMDRTKSGITDFSREFPAVTSCKVFTADGSVKLRLFVDRSSIELFANDGRAVMTNLVFPTAPYTSLSIKAQGGNAKINSLKVYSIKL